MSNKVTKFKEKSRTVPAMQFDGKNAKDIKAWISKYPDSDVKKVTNGPNWFKIDDGSGYPGVARVGDFILLRTFESLPGVIIFVVMTKEMFLENHNIPKSFDVV